MFSATMLSLLFAVLCTSANSLTNDICGQ